MMELEINGQVYGFNFSIGFLKEINKKITMPDESIPKKMKEVGFKYYVAELLDGNVLALIEILKTANIGTEPRITEKMLSDYIDEESTDIDGLFEAVKDFLFKANATKKDFQKMQKAYEEQKEAEEAQRIAEKKMRDALLMNEKTS